MKTENWKLLMRIGKISKFPKTLGENFLEFLSKKC